MATGEVMNLNNKAEKNSAKEAIKDKIKEMGKLGDKVGDKIQNKLEKKESNDLLKNFKYVDLVKNNIVSDALKDPENKEKIQAMQGELGYNKVLYNKPESKNYYPEEHRKDMKEPDGIAGKYTMEALYNMVADGLIGDEKESDKTQQLSKDSEDQTDKEKNEQANKILDAYVILRYPESKK